MSSRVASRNNGSSTTTTTSRQQYPNGAAVPHYGRRAQAPPPVKYTVESVRDKYGKEQEVLTLEDTPEPSATASRAGPTQAYASTSQARNDPYSGYEPAPKKRKSDAAGQVYNGYPQTNGYQTGPDVQTYRQIPQQQRQQPVASGSGQKRKHDEYARDPEAQRSSNKGKEKQISSKADAEGHFIVRIGDIVSHFEYRVDYQIERLLGQGTFGKVVAAKVVRSPNRAEVGTAVAVKIIRNVQKYQEAAKTEIRVLQRLTDADPEKKKNCIRLQVSFNFHGHTCLVTELLSASVFDFLKENAYEPFPLSHVQQFGKQLLLALQFVHKNNLVHTDLKPENILLLDNRSTVVPSRKSKTRKLLNKTDICLIDFGSATFEDEYHASVVSTRHYRAPEIILCLGWSYPCDMWSVGCILVEFVTGEALFQTHENLEHLAMMEKVFGPMPRSMLLDAKESVGGDHPDWFKTTGAGKKKEVKLNFPQPSTQKQSKKYVTGMKSLRDIVGTTDPARERFYDLCKGLLTWQKKDRLDVQAALRHPFFSTKITDEGTTYRPQ